MAVYVVKEQLGDASISIEVPKSQIDIAEAMIAALADKFSVPAESAHSTASSTPEPKKCEKCNATIDANGKCDCGSQPASDLIDGMQQMAEEKGIGDALAKARAAAEESLGIEHDPFTDSCKCPKCQAAAGWTKEPTEEAKVLDFAALGKAMDAAREAATKPCCICTAPGTDYDPFCECACHGEPTGWTGGVVPMPTLKGIAEVSNNPEPEGGRPLVDIPSEDDVVTSYTAFGISIPIPPADHDETPITRINTDGTGGGQLKALNSALTGIGYGGSHRHRTINTLFKAFGIDKTIGSTTELTKAEAHLVISWIDTATVDAKHQLFLALQEGQGCLI